MNGLKDDRPEPHRHAYVKPENSNMHPVKGLCDRTRMMSCGEFQVEVPESGWFKGGFPLRSIITISRTGTDCKLNSKMFSRTIRAISGCCVLSH